MNRPISITLLVFVLLWAPLSANALEVKSPNGRILLRFSVDATENPKTVVYAVDYDGKPLVGNSRLRFALNELQDDKSTSTYCGDHLEILSHDVSKHDESWKPVYGERSLVRDHYHQMVIRMRDRSYPELTITATMRAYDAGVAFRVGFERASGEGAIEIVEERTEFTFLQDHSTWVTRTAQGLYEKVTISTMGKDVERPLPLCTDENSSQGTYVAIAEAGLVDYARMKLRRSKENPFQIISQLSGKVNLATPAQTPWRVVMIGDSPGALLESNDIILNLNDPCAIKDTSWIKPGKVIRETTLTDEGAKACIEFAVKHNLQYVEFDAGWYGAERDDASDATSVTLDPKRSKGPLHLQERIKEANDKGLGVILYVNRRELEKKLDTLLPLYQSWGVKGLKYGFVQVGSQEWTRWLHEAIRKAADHELMVDVHDEYRMTGFCRTYPNLMTVEGIGGDETSPTNRETLTQLFSIMLAGTHDNTICYFNDRVERNQDHAAQLAKAMIMYNPWQFLYWYDSPSNAFAERKRNGEGVIHETPELEFWDHMPTVWDDSRVLAGQIGEFAIVARRSGEGWFVGALNSERPQRLTVSLDFLSLNKTYIAHIYADDDSLETRTHVRIDRWKVTSETELKIQLDTNSGQAIRIVPANAEDDSIPDYPS